MLVRINTNDAILSTHRDWNKSLISLPINETFFDSLEIDVNKLSNDFILKKGQVVSGLWRFVKEWRTETKLTTLMIEYLNKEIEIDSLRYKRLIAVLRDHNLSFDQWIENYKEKGEAEKLKKEKSDLEDAEKKALEHLSFKQAQEDFEGASYSFPAVSGLMGDNIYYTIQIPMPQLVQLFHAADETLPVEQRSQRILNEKRAKGIADYLCDRPFDYILPALTASISKKMKFTPAEGFSNLGELKIPIDAETALSDGAHRLFATSIALERNYPHFKKQSLSVCVFYDQGLHKAQQQFADINSKAVKPPKSLSVLFDKTNLLNKLVLDVINTVGINHAIEFDKTNPSSKSNKVWGVSVIKKVIESLTGLNEKKANELFKPMNKETEEKFLFHKKYLVEFFNKIISVFPDLSNALVNGDAELITDLKSNKVVLHAVFLQCLAESAKYFNPINEGYDFIEFDELQTLSLNKNNDSWRGRIVNADGTMNPTRNGIKLGASLMIKHMQLIVPDDLLELEKVVFNKEL